MSLPKPTAVQLAERRAPSLPPAIVSGAFHAYFAFDAAESIDLDRLQAAGEDSQRAPLQLRREATSGFIAFPTPPVVVRLPKGPNGWELRAKIFNYGAISIRISAPFSGSWDEFAAFTRSLRVADDLADQARTALSALMQRSAPALEDPQTDPLVEDYFVFEVQSFAASTSAADLLGPYGSQLASLLLCEERRLTSDEQNETLRVNFSYFEDDLVVVQWDTAFVYDRSEGATAIEDILEFANTQLVELRTYDALLDAELNTIYKLDPARRRFGRRQAQLAADRIRYLIVEVQALTDSASNALKIIGDAYYARLYRGAAGRLGLRDWQRQIDVKLESIGDMYGFFNDQVQHARSEFLEVIVILLIAIEVVVGLLSLRH